MTPTILSGWLLALSLLVMALVAIVLLAGMVVTRSVRLHKERVAARRMAPLRPLLLEVAAGEDDDHSAAEQLIRLQGKDRALVQAAALRLLPKLKGAPAIALATVLDGLGLRRTLSRDLRSWSPVRRGQAAWVAGLLQETDCTDELVALLTDRSPEVRTAALRALGHIGNPTAAAAILAASGAVRGTIQLPAEPVVEALSQLGPQIAPAVGAALAASDPHIRAVAAQTVGNAQLSTLCQRLHEVLAEEDNDEVKGMQLWAMGQVGRAREARQVAPYLEAGHSRQVRAAAAGALGAIGHPDAVPSLVPLLGDRDRRLAARGAEALASLGTPGLEALRAAQCAGGVTGRAAFGALALRDLRTTASMRGVG